MLDEQATWLTEAALSVLSEALRWRVQLLMQGFEDGEVDYLSYLRWLHDRGRVGGPWDGARRA
jgi:hypothetical protein